MADKKVHKRFAAFLVSSGLLVAGFYAGDISQFETFAQTLGFIYAAYLGGQSATDWRVAANGASQ